MAIRTQSPFSPFPEFSYKIQILYVDSLQSGGSFATPVLCQYKGNFFSCLWQCFIKQRHQENLKLHLPLCIIITLRSSGIQKDQDLLIRITKMGVKSAVSDPNLVSLITETKPNLVQQESNKQQLLYILSLREKTAIPTSSAQQLHKSKSLRR